MPSLRHVAAAPLAATLAGFALVAAGCGGGGPSGSAVANIGTTATTATTVAAASTTPVTGQDKAQAAFAFSKCMRANGVPNFPDPQTSGGATRLDIGAGSGIDPSSPKFQAAQQKCRKLLPNGGQPSPAQVKKLEQQALAFSKCMRSHGVPNFPDPQFSTSGGGVGIRLRAGGPGSGLDPNSPTFQAAQKACAGKLPGLVKGQPGAVRSGSTSSGTSSAGKP